MCIVNSAFAVPILLYTLALTPAADLPQRWGIPPPFENRKGMRFYSRATCSSWPSYHNMSLPEELLAYCVFLMTGFPKWEVTGLDMKTDFRLPAQASVATNSEKVMVTSIVDKHLCQLLFQRHTCP